MSERTCSIEDCEREHYARGWCFLHYERWHRNGDPLTLLRPPNQPRTSDVCGIADCERDYYARGWCKLHWRRWATHGDPQTVLVARGAPAADRFWAKVDRDGPLSEYRPDLGPCWLWAGSLDAAGYGKFKHDGGQLAYRFSYELNVGQIPDGLRLDHLCRVPACVRPDHLEPVTHRINIIRGHIARGTLRQGHLADDAYPQE